jgi:hypothetical protein
MRGMTAKGVRKGESRWRGREGGKRKWKWGREWVDGGDLDENEKERMMGGKRWKGN